MMPQYKLTYFDAKARAEVCRMMFAFAGQQYEDIRVDFQEWGKLKPNTVYGTLPILEVNGKKYGQSVAIQRYLARQFGLYPHKVEDQLLADGLNDYIVEFFDKLVKLRFFKEEGEHTLAKELKEFNEDKVPKFYENLEKLVNSDGFFIGKKLSWPDLALAHIYDFTLGTDGIKLDQDKIPKLMALNKRVLDNPKIAAWIAKRPNTKF